MAEAGAEAGSHLANPPLEVTTPGDLIVGVVLTQVDGQRVL